MERRGANFQDIRDLMRFIGSFWGALAALSISFAWINSWLVFIPRHPTVENIASALALLAAVFAFLYAYVEGEEEGIYLDDPTGFRRRAPSPNQPTLRAAFGRFAWAILALTVYLTLMTLYNFVAPSRDAGPSLIGAALVPALLITYTAMFGFLTAALTSLAVVHRLAARRNRTWHPTAPPLASDELTEILPFGGVDKEDGRLASDLRPDRAH